MNVLLLGTPSQVGPYFTNAMRAEEMHVIQPDEVAEGVRMVQETPPEIVIAATLQPEPDGFAVCRRLRRAGIDVPVLILTTLPDTISRRRTKRVAGNAYLQLPCTAEQFIEAVLLTATNGKTSWQVGELTVDIARHRVYNQSEAVALAATEFALLAYMVRHTGQVLSREQLLRRVWGEETTTETKEVDVYVHYLRQKLGQSKQNNFLQSVRGKGYRLLPLRSLTVTG
ncbi:MAG: response regulator transcription factor [Firmicutes bacterium]|nr:response regulator transcription factor [Bacillota bacterium]